MTYIQERIYILGPVTGSYLAEVRAAIKPIMFNATARIPQQLHSSM